MSNNWSGNITDVRANGNSSGAHVGVSGQITKPVGSGGYVTIGGSVDRSQSFKGYGGRTTYGGSVGVGIKF